MTIYIYIYICCISATAIAGVLAGGFELGPFLPNSFGKWPKVNTLDPPAIAEKDTSLWCGSPKVHLPKLDLPDLRWAKLPGEDMLKKFPDPQIQ